MAILSSMQLILFGRQYPAPTYPHPTPYVDFRENLSIWKCMAGWKNLKNTILENGFHYISNGSHKFLNSRKEVEAGAAAFSLQRHLYFEYKKLNCKKKKWTVLITNKTPTNLLSKKKKREVLITNKTPTNLLSKKKKKLNCIIKCKRLSCPFSGRNTKNLQRY